MSKNPNDKQIIELIRRSRNILILPSAPPDGDCLGSALSLYMVLKKLEKNATIVCSETVPELLKFLPNIKLIGNQVISSDDFIINLDCKNAKVNSIKTLKENDRVRIIISPREGRFSEEHVSFNKGEVDFDLVIVVDCAELTQLGSIYENNTEMFFQIPVINIDHHISNTHFGKINHVDIMASSTTEILLPIIEDLSEEEGKELIDEDVATLLLTGIITDTGSFQNANTTPRAFGKAAQLISYGARQQEIIQHIYKTKQLSQLKLWGRVLSKIQTDEKYKIVWSVVSQQDFRDTESFEDQTGDIIDELMTNAPGAEIVLLMKEKKDGGISVSVRTTTPAVDASKFAEIFSGGGHTQAAGFRVNNLSILDAEYKVINAVRDFQSDRLGILKDNGNEQNSNMVSEPIIDVKELLQRAKEAQKASEIIQSVPEKASTPSTIPTPTISIDEEENINKEKNKSNHKQEKNSDNETKKSKTKKGFTLLPPTAQEEKKEVILEPGTIYKFEE